MAKMKNSIPEYPFIRFKLGKIIFSGMIIAADNKNYKVKYSPKNPNCSNFFNCSDTVNISILSALPYKL